MMMDKFKKGDRVRCVSDEAIDIHVGKVYLVDGCSDAEVFFKDDGGFSRERPVSRYELATPSPIPDTVTIGGIEYVRKPEREHVWAWGQWARVDADHKYIPNEKVFVTGPTKANGWVPISHPKGGSLNYTDGLCPADLTYISDATIPE